MAKLPEPNVLVAHIDMDGMPRAYAFGPLSDLENVRQRADAELAAYLEQAIAPSPRFVAIELRSDQGRGLLNMN